MKTKCLDRMVKKQQRRLRRAQKKFLGLKGVKAGRRALLYDLDVIGYSSDTKLAVAFCHATSHR